MSTKEKQTFLKDAAKIAASTPYTPTTSTNQSTQLSEDDLIIQRALSAVELKNKKIRIQEADDKDTTLSADSSTDDKGLFGNRQVEFAQDVYFLPKTLTGDKSQPVGLITQSDLANYVAYRKGDRLTFRYLNGQAGACKYEAKRNGQDGYKCDFDWSDGLIQELIDENACKLID